MYAKAQDSDVRWGPAAVLWWVIGQCAGTIALPKEIDKCSVSCGNEKYSGGDVGLEKGGPLVKGRACWFIHSQ